MDKKETLIRDIESLLNGYDGLKNTTIDPAMLSFLDEAALKSIIASLLEQKEQIVESNLAWLEQFKKY